MILCSRSSTSSRVRARLLLFCDISSPEVATPPALAAVARPIKDFRIEEKLRRLERARQVRAFGNQWDAVIDKRFRAAHVFSFCVALGNAQSALMLQIGLYGFR